MDPLFKTYTRQDLHDMDRPMWKRLREANRDPLRFRQFMLRVHGRETLINCIFQDHGQPNRY